MPAALKIVTLCNCKPNISVKKM